jgi:hypothetical protein
VKWFSEDDLDAAKEEAASSKEPACIVAVRIPTRYVLIPGTKDGLVYQDCVGKIRGTYADADVYVVDHRGPTLDDVKKYVRESGVDENDLALDIDELVFDMVSQEGSDANNGGVDCQLNFLSKHMTTGEIMDYVKDLVEVYQRNELEDEE